VGKPEGKMPLGRLRSRWGDTIKMDLGAVGWDGMDWIHLAEDLALVNTALNVWVP
jgi:hypothetical protein